MEEKVYHKPDMEICHADTDVICTSTPDNDVPFLTSGGWLEG